MTATNAPSLQNTLSAEQKAHEPSMDDILASIRRIIADDDALPLSRRPRAAAPAEASAQVGAAQPAVAPQAVPSQPSAPSLVPSADAFLGLGQRLGRNADVSAPEKFAASAPAAALAQPPMLRLRDFMPREAQKLEQASKPGPAQLAPQTDLKPQTDIKPQVDIKPKSDPEPQAAVAPSLAAEEPMALRPSLAEPEKPADPPGASVVSLVQPSASAGEPRLKIASLSFRAPVFKPPAAAQEAPAEQPAPPSAPVAAAPVAATPAPVAAAPEQPAPEPAPEISENTLLSSASGAKIGASFEALAESMLLRDPQMVERMTREMLRPMLKAWLDDNLPIVVERLVRAEIERVARGRG